MMSIIMAMPYLFPSPLGELYFLINVDRLYEVFTGVSVPSRGAIFLNNSELDVWKAVMLVSVPSRGAIFLNAYPKHITLK